VSERRVTDMWLPWTRPIRIDDMRPAARTVFVGVLIAGVVASLAYVCTMRLCAKQMAADDLSWLKREFRLGDADMRRIQRLHEGYMPKCRDMCARIAEKQGELEKALEKGEAPDARLLELATLRAQCQAQMLRHFEEVSRAMPPEQGKRYLSEMQKLTLGFHQDFEHSMGDMPASSHGHGDH
jgi:hypothetical protein